MRLATPCTVCNNKTNHPSQKCWRHRTEVSHTSMAFLTRPENAHLLKMELAKIELVKIITGNQDPLTVPREELPLFDMTGSAAAIPVRNDQLPNSGTHIPKYAMYNGRRVQVIAQADGASFEILIEESRTTVDRDRLIFIK